MECLALKLQFGHLVPVQVEEYKNTARIQEYILQYMQYIHFITF